MEEFSQMVKLAIYITQINLMEPLKIGHFQLFL